MDALVDLSWRLYPAAAIMAAGAAMVAWGALTLFRTDQIDARDRGKAILLVSGIRLLLMGGAIAALGASWYWQQFWLLVLALAIGGEELLETSFVLFILRRGKRLDEQALASGSTLAAAAGARSATDTSVTGA